MTGDPTATRLVSTVVLVAASGVTYRQADHWCRRGYLRVEHLANQGRRVPPGEATAPWRGTGGSGLTRMHPASEVAVAHAVGRLLDIGLALAPAFMAARAYVDDGVTHLVLADGVALVLSFPPPLLPDDRSDEQKAHNLAVLGQIVDEDRAVLAALDEQEAPCPPPTT